jgi:hypothetical protein
MKPARALIIGIAMLGLATPTALAAGGFSCSQIPDAQRYLDSLRPGPNTQAAQSHLDAAKHAANDQQCVAELREVDKYARRSEAADHHAAVHHHRMLAQRCADPLHQNRPGGSDYHGPPVPGCP